MNLVAAVSRSSEYTAQAWMMKQQTDGQKELSVRESNPAFARSVIHDKRVY